MGVPYVRTCIYNALFSEVFDGIVRFADPGFAWSDDLWPVTGVFDADEFFVEVWHDHVRIPADDIFPVLG